jgi:tRNA(Ile)-lysidine synthase TilS/MesJ
MKVERKVLKQFNKGCVDYHLLEDGDRILIALSGGKDSLELVRLLAQRARIFKDGGNYMTNAAVTINPEDANNWMWVIPAKEYEYNNAINKQ